MFFFFLPLPVSPPSHSLSFSPPLTHESTTVDFTPAPGSSDRGLSAADLPTSASAPANRRCAGPRRPSPALCGVRRWASRSSRQQQPVVPSSGAAPTAVVEQLDTTSADASRIPLARQPGLQDPARRGRQGATAGSDSFYPSHGQSGPGGSHRRARCTPCAGESSGPSGEEAQDGRSRVGPSMAGASGSKAGGSRDPTSSPAPLLLPICGGREVGQRSGGRSSSVSYISICSFNFAGGAPPSPLLCFPAVISPPLRWRGATTAGRGGA
jgi:hypothetical protein